MEYIERFKYVKTKLVITLFLIVLFIYYPIFSNWIFDFLLKTNILALMVIHTIKKDRFITGIFQIFIALLIYLLLSKYIWLNLFYFIIWLFSLVSNTIAWFINISEYSYWYFNERTIPVENQDNKDEIVYKNTEEVIKTEYTDLFEQNTTNINKEDAYDIDIENENKYDNRFDNSNEDDLFEKASEHKNDSIDLFWDDDIEDVQDPFSVTEELQNKENWNISWCFNPLNCIASWEEFILTEDVFNQIITI